ncbi:hypothetical protein A2773_06430 [Candidatus Gottesmanbacteria bacterium RIFCSPHIGHO2_01_FULL_39_10]|uniref:Uncharacterized protein n=1 Tax=Candidatus Gottesmanbacteria bacterium RIFCSPHIGHO2_01_FULL_39_10 TaxID=1798375 RepID=A0A1F5ZNZ4_9BACT|nr:MAG: hypothetical protein A2773_06430 [Candidatus Gottesmanbacteria bacterium RIFCSPHIGHO2_01_FULL_39_10]
MKKLYSIFLLSAVLIFTSLGSYVLPQRVLAVESGEYEGEESVLEAEAAVTPGVGPGVYQDTNSNVKYKKSWSNPKNGGDGTYKDSAVINASLRLVFKGTEIIRVRLRKASNAGKAHIRIKEVGGGIFRDVDVDLRKSGGAIFDNFNTQGLNPNKKYRIRVSVKGANNVSTGVVGFDKFTLVGGGGGVPPSAPPTSAATRTPTPSSVPNPSRTPTPTVDPDNESAENENDPTEIAAETAVEGQIENEMAAQAAGTSSVYENSDPKVKYRSDAEWNKNADDPASSNNSDKVALSNVKNAKAVLKFKGGTKLTVQFSTTNDSGKASVRLKKVGGSVVGRKKVNLYTSSPSHNNSKAVFTGLNKNDTYIATVTVLRKKVPASGGKRVMLDKFVVEVPPSPTPTTVVPPQSSPTPTVDPEDEAGENENDPTEIAAEVVEEGQIEAEMNAEAAGTTTVYEDSDPKVKYKRDWQKNQDDPASSNNADKVAVSNSKNAKAILKFKGGKKLTVQFSTGADAGKVSVRVKKVGGAVVGRKKVNLYKANNSIHNTQAEFTGLNKNDTYIATVTVLRKKVPGSGGKLVRLDKFLVDTSGVPTATVIPGGPTLTPTPTVDPEDEEEENENDPDEIAAEEAEEAGIEAEMEAEAADSKTIYEDNDPKVKYKKNWQKIQDDPASTVPADKVSISDVKGAKAILKFTGGKQLTVQFSTNMDAGKVSVRVKKTGGPVVGRKKVNLYKPGASIHNNTKAVFTGLNKSDTYIATVTVLRKKKKASTGKKVYLDKFIVDTSRGPTATPTTGGPTLTPTPTEGAEEGWKIPIGEKDSLTINIGTVPTNTPGGPTATPTPTGVEGTPTPTPTGNPNIPHVTFKTKLYGAAETPDIKVRLKVVDLEESIADDAEAGSCEEPGTGEIYLKDLTLTANSAGEYSPKPGSTFTLLPGGTTHVVSAEGWVPMFQTSKNKNYSLLLKGPKHVNIEMEDNYVMKNNTAPEQNFDWTGNLLYAGDVPDPENDFVQDCVVNAADISLVKNRVLSETGREVTDEDLVVADLDYNERLNALDMGQMTTTLSTRPDED